MLRNKRGISLTTMVITVFIMLIIMGTLVYSAVDSVKIRKLNKMYNDLRQLDDAVSIYYLKNGELPIKGEVKEILKDTALTDEKLSFVINGKAQAAGASDFFNPNDYDASRNKAEYYEINLNLMDGLTLNYPTNTYIVNVNSHTIYNYTGVTIGSDTYYALPLKYKDIKYKENNAVSAIKLKSVSGVTDGSSTVYLGYSTESINLKDYLTYDSSNGVGLGEPKEVAFKYTNEGTALSEKYYDLDTKTGKLTRNATVLATEKDITNSNSNPQIEVTASNYDSSKPAKTKTLYIQLSSINVKTKAAPSSIVDHINLSTKQTANTYKDMKTSTGDNVYALERYGGVLYPSANPNVTVVSSDAEVATGNYTKPTSGGDFGKVSFSSASGTKPGKAKITFQVSGLGNATDTIPVYVYDFKMYEGAAGSNTNISKLDFNGTGDLQAKTVHLNVTAPDGITLNYADGGNIAVEWSEASYNTETGVITKLETDENKTGIISKTVKVTDYINATITPKATGTTYLLCEYSVEGELLGKSLIPITVYGSISATGLTETDTIVLAGTAENANNTVELTYSLLASAHPEGTTVEYTASASNTSITVVPKEGSSGVFTATCNQDTSTDVTITATVKNSTTNEVVGTYSDTVKITYTAYVPPASP